MYGAPRTLGALAGFSTGAGQTFSGLAGAAVGGTSFVTDLYADPVATMAAVGEQLAVLTQLDQWPQYVAAMAASFEEQMDRANPYEEGTSDYETFKDNYYAGMLVFEVALTVGTGGVAQGAKQSATASKIASAASGTRIATAAGAVTRAYRGASAPARIAKQRLVSTAARGASLTVDGASALYAPTKTVGSTITASQRLPSVDLDVSSLSRAEKRMLGRETIRADGGVDFDARIERLLIDSESVDTDLATRLQRLRNDGELSDADVDELKQLLDSDNMDRDGAQSFVSMLNDKDTHSLVDGAVQGEDLLKLAKENELSKSNGVVVRNGQIINLKSGDIDSGWEHINARHLEGTHDIETQGGTSLFPAGRTVKGTELPDSVSSSDVQKMVFDSIKRGQRSGDTSRSKYYFKPKSNGYPESGIDEMRVIVRDGALHTSFPLSGEDVLKYVPDLNDGDGGFVET